MTDTKTPVAIDLTDEKTTEEADYWEKEAARIHMGRALGAAIKLYESAEREVREAYAAWIAKSIGGGNDRG